MKEPPAVGDLRGEGLSAQVFTAEGWVWICPQEPLDPASALDRIEAAVRRYYESDGAAHGDALAIAVAQSLVAYKLWLKARGS